MEQKQDRAVKILRYAVYTRTAFTVERRKLIGIVHWNGSCMHVGRCCVWLCGHRREIAREI